jgi:hypothetical protein
MPYINSCQQELSPIAFVWPATFSLETFAGILLHPQSYLFSRVGEFALEHQGGL